MTHQVLPSEHMIQHQFQQFRNGLGKINNIISFHESIAQLCFPFLDDTSNTTIQNLSYKAF